MTIRARRRGMAALAVCALSLLSAQTAAPPSPAKSVSAPQQNAAGTPSVPPADPGWPRTVSRDGHSLTYYQPQVDEWENQLKLKGRMALALTPQGAKEPIFGGARIEGDTQTDTENRTVYLYNIRLTTVHFPIEDSSAEKVEAAARELFVQPAIVIALDRLLAGLQVGQSGVRETKVSLEPPKILYSNKPAVLVMVDGKPVLLDIETSGLQQVLNTNWDLLFDKSGSHYYLLDKQTWLTAQALEGPWSVAKALPVSFQKLPQTDDWAEVRKNVPPKAKAGAPPAVFVTYEPAELILVDGNAKMDRIKGTLLSAVTNTESDLFFHQGDRYYYLLTSGRWFRADSLEGPWRSAAQDLPDDFAKIPADDPSASVLASVRGTRQAEEAILVASIPQTATLNRKTASAQAEFVGGEPAWELIPGTSVSYAKNTQQDVFKIGDLYYLCFQGAWFVANSTAGPWEVSDSVPKEVSSIPPESPKHNVTYVNVYNSTPTSVTYGYTAGYIGMYIAMGTLMWGTGYYYPPYWGGYGRYPVYWPPPYATWGTAAFYNPYTGGYGRRTVAYGPYGGYGYSSVYNPRTGAYARGSSAWGPGGYAWRAGGYNPTTGRGGVAGGYYDAWSGNYGAGYRGGNQYSRWGEGVVGEGDDWVHAKYRVERGQGGAIGIETSEGDKLVGVGSGGNRGFIGKDEDNNIYAGRDGNVYKRDDGGDWHQNVGGDWEEVSKERVDSARQQAQQRADETRKQRGAQPGQTRQGQTPSTTATQDRAAARANQGRVQPGTLPTTDRAARPQQGAAGGAATRPGEGRVQPGTLPTTDRTARAQQGAAGASRNRPSTTNRPETMRGLEGEARARRDGAARSRQYESRQRSGGGFSGRSSRGGGRRRR